MSGAGRARGSRCCGQALAVHGAAAVMACPRCRDVAGPPLHLPACCPTPPCPAGPTPALPPPSFLYHYTLGAQLARFVRLSSKLGAPTTPASFIASFVLSSTVLWQSLDALAYRMRYHRFVLLKPLVLLCSLPLERHLCESTCAAAPGACAVAGRPLARWPKKAPALGAARLASCAATAHIDVQRLARAAATSGWVSRSSSAAPPRLWPAAAAGQARHFREAAELVRLLLAAFRPLPQHLAFDRDAPSGARAVCARAACTQAAAGAVQPLLLRCQVLLRAACGSSGAGRQACPHGTPRCMRCLPARAAFVCSRHAVLLRGAGPARAPRAPHTSRRPRLPLLQAMGGPASRPRQPGAHALPTHMPP